MTKAELGISLMLLMAIVSPSTGAEDTLSVDIFTNKSRYRVVCHAIRCFDKKAVEEELKSTSELVSVSCKGSDAGSAYCEEQRERETAKKSCYENLCKRAHCRKEKTDDQGKKTCVQGYFKDTFLESDMLPHAG